MTAYNIWQWFQENEASPGSTSDKIQRYLSTRGFTEANNEAMYDWLGSLGFTGTLAERIYQFEFFKTYRYNDIAAKEVLEKFGTDAHCWIPGIGYFNGLQASNFIDSAGTQAGLVDNPVGLVMDAEGSLGAELVTNGDFSNGLTSWVVQQPTAGSVAVLAGECRFNSTDGSLAYIQQTICTVGRTYSVNLNVVNVSSGLLAISDGSANYITFNTTGAKSFVFVATSSVFQVKRVSGVTDITIDNISVREVTGAITATQGTTANKPILRRGAVNLLTYSTLPGGGANPTGWAGAFTTGASAPVISILGADATAYLYTCVAQRYVHTQQFTLTSNATYTLSVRVESVSGTIPLEDCLNATGLPVGCALSNWRLNNNAATNSTQAAVGLITATLSGTYTGTTVNIRIGAGCFNGNVTATVQLSRPQLELGSTASEYIPTTTAAASSSSGNYYWQFDGSNDSLALSSVPFQTQDNHAVVVGFSRQSSGVNPRIFALTSAGSAVIHLRIDSTQNQAFYLVIDDAGTSATTGVSNAAEIPNGSTIFIASLRQVGNARIGRLNGVLKGTNSTTLSTSTLTGGTIGSSGASAYFGGSIYPVIAIKGTISDDDLLILERWVGAMAGVSF